MGVSVSGVRLDGCLFGPASARDFRTVFSDRAVPDRVDLRQYCTAVEQQGEIGSCTANAAVGALEYHYNRRDGRAPDLSRMFVYFNSRRLRGQVLFDSGAEIREAMGALVAFGACREELWPYDPGLFAMEPPPQAYADAQGHQAVQYARVDGGQGALSAIAQGLPVVFGARIPKRCFDEAETTGVLAEPTREELDVPWIGGHAMLIVGYDQPARMFIVRNSWGPEWGDRGYCRIPFAVMDACARPEDFWVVAELENKRGLQLIRPRGREAAPAAAPLASGSGIASAAAKMRDEIRSKLDTDIASSGRKIDAMLAGGFGRRRGPRDAMTRTLPCAACGGSGTCPSCHGTSAACARCGGTGTCAECGGAGEV